MPWLQRFRLLNNRGNDRRQESRCSARFSDPAEMVDRQVSSPRRRACLIDSGIGPLDPEVTRRPPQIRTSPIEAYGSSRLRVHYMTEWTILAGIRGNTRSMPSNCSQLGGRPRLRRPSHLRHSWATCHRSFESMR